MLQKAIELLVSCFATAELFNVTVLVQPQSKKYFKCFNFHSFSKTNTCSAHLWISASHTHYKWRVFFPTFATWRTVIMNNCAKHYHSGIYSSGFLLVIKWGQKPVCFLIRTVLMHYKHPTNATVLYSQPSRTSTINGTGTLCQQSCYCWLFQWVSGVITGKRHLLAWILSHQCPVCSSCHWDASYTPHILLPIESKFYVVDQT